LDPGQAKNVIDISWYDTMMGRKVVANESMKAKCSDEQL
jgi:hypothetical protein